MSRLAISVFAALSFLPLAGHAQDPKTDALSAQLVDGTKLELTDFQTDSKPLPTPSVPGDIGSRVLRIDSENETITHWVDLRQIASAELTTNASYRVMLLDKTEITGKIAGTIKGKDELGETELKFGAKASIQKLAFPKSTSSVGSTAKSKQSASGEKATIIPAEIEMRGKTIRVESFAFAGSYSYSYDDPFRVTLGGQPIRKYDTSQKFTMSIEIVRGETKTTTPLEKLSSIKLTGEGKGSPGSIVKTRSNNDISCSMSFGDISAFGASVVGKTSYGSISIPLWKDNKFTPMTITLGEPQIPPPAKPKSR